MEKAGKKYHNRGGKKKAAKYYQDNKDVIKEKTKNKYKNLSAEEEEVKKVYSKNRYKKRKKMQIYFYSIKISEQALQFDDIVINKNEFHASK